MALVINTNVSSLNAQRNLTSSQSTLQTSLQRLSTGLRINSAKDDAAGLAISERFTSQIRGMNQATRNANDAISLSQTAEGSLGEYSNILQRVRELSLQSANATNSSSDRAALNSETQQLLSELGRISTTTQFNGQNVLDGSFSAAQFQVGANANQTISVSIGNASTDSLGSYTFNNSQTAVSSTALSSGNLTINGVDIGASTSGSAESKAAAINSKTSETGVTATASTAFAAESSPTGSVALQTGDLVINGTAIGGIALTYGAGAQGTAIADAINAVSNTTGVTATSNSTTGAISLNSTTGKDIALTTNNGVAGASRVENATGINMVDTALTNLATNDLTVNSTKATASFTAVNTAASGESVTINVGGSAQVFDFYDSGVAAYGGANIGVDIATDSVAALNSALTTAFGSDATIATSGNDVTVSSNVLGVIDFGASETMASGASTSVAGTGITVGDTLIVGGQTYTFTNGTSTGNNIDLNVGTAGTTTTLAASIAGKIATNNGVSTNIDAINTGNVVNITADLFGTAGNATVAATGTAVGAGELVASVSTTTDGAYAANTTYGTLDLTSSENFQIGGDNAALAGLATASVSLTAINTIDISSVAGANAAIGLVDSALSQVTSIRGDLGAIQNRLESTVSNLSSTAESLSAARSRIRDADYAAETAELTRTQILQQAGVAMLAQANSLPQQVLSLLQ